MPRERARIRTASLTRARWLAALALLLVNLVPLVAMLPVVSAWSNGTISGHALLPLLAVPTVLITAYHRRRITFVLQAVAMVSVPVVVLISSPTPVAPRLLQTACVLAALVLAVFLVRRMRSFLVNYLADLHTAAIVDPLTGVLNRRGMVRQLPELAAVADEAGERIGVALVDLDHFKLVNDTYGHAAGDAVLREIAQIAEGAVGAGGAVARTGGEEFLLVTVGDALPAAERLVAAVRQRTAEPAVTVSVGIASVSTAECVQDRGWSVAVSTADAALYRAKYAGRDRIEVAGTRGGHLATASRSGSADVAPFTDSGALRRTVRRGRRPIDSAEHPSPTEVVRATLRSGAVSRYRPVSRLDRTLYQAIVLVTVLLGVGVIAENAVDDGLALNTSLVLFIGGILVAGAMLWWLGTVRMAHRLLPLLAVSTAIQLAAVFLAPGWARIFVLFTMMLMGLVVVSYWTRAVFVVHLVATAIACIGAAWIPGRPAVAIVVLAVLMAGSFVTALAVVGAKRRQVEQAERDLYWRSVTDPLTGLGNRRALDSVHARWRSGLVLIADIDHFKQLNDAHGHAYGDDVLRRVGMALDQIARSICSQARAFRIGGDEFVIAVPGSAARGTGAVSLAGRVQVALAALSEPVSVTIGAGWWPRLGASGLWDALSLADRDLIRLKRARNAANRDAS